MATVSGGGGIHALCEDALAEILVRLPSLSVLRCRAVCKTWRRLATDRSFLVAHAARRPREVIVLTEHCLKISRGATPLSLDLEPEGGDDGGRRCSRRRLPYLYDPCPRAEDGTTRTGAFDLRASLDGLLVLEELLRGRGTFIVCNPTTRQWTNLPALTHQCSAAYACGFYFHASSGEYRLLCHGVEGADGNSSPGPVLCWGPFKFGGPGRPHRLVTLQGRPCSSHYYYILSAGSARPRRLARAPSCRPKPSNSNEVLYDIPVSYRGNLHWFSEHPLGGQTGKMLAFDTASEAFRLMPRPPELAAEWPDRERMRDLLVLDGELSVATLKLLELDIWVLQEYEAAGRWALRHRVTLPRPRDVRVVGVPPAICRALPVGRSGILIACPTATMGTVYDLKEKEGRGVVDIGGFPRFAVFSESLVPHAFFDLPPSPDIVPPKFFDPSDERINARN
ncbi:unnamed protein product [Urochloa decumbens]|uniref:F-box domain-containing protein n=1 Tax=Urochloa decumbens TaxID=240449 RepID=A0ABC8W2S7_9POAL